MNRIRFTVRHLLIATLLVSACLGASVLILRHQYRESIEDVYGKYEVYELLRDSNVFEILRVSSRPNEKRAGIGWSFPSGVTAAHSRFLRDRDAQRLRKILTSTEDFVVDYDKSYVFRPTQVLRATNDEHRVDIYFCFDSEMAAIVLDGQRVDVLTIDKVASELRELLGVVPVPPEN